ncbi:hypothetical protein HDV03_002417 [Kappamyces sp. JEL0829]|nr:hypothetical protein HDV03_002417 [Kappamyces sp. JEL0829]
MPSQIEAGQIEAYQRALQIEAQLADDRLKMQAYNRTPKLLILGSGNSGKTTLLKQLTILDGKGYSNKEKALLKQKMLSQAVDSLKLLVRVATSLQLPLGSGKEAEAIMKIPQDLSAPFGAELYSCIQRFMAMDSVKRACLVGHQYNLVSNAEYLIANIQNYTDPVYLVTNEDILNVRVQTTGISETPLQLKGGMIVYDVGGQRGLRKQWAQYFDNVNTVFFVTDLSCYDQMLEEDGTVNRMVDALELFKDLINSPILKRIPLVLLLNKIDMLRKKLRHSDVSKYFSSFKGRLRRSPQETRTTWPM